MKKILFRFTVFFIIITAAAGATVCYLFARDNSDSSVPQSISSTVSEVQKQRDQIINEASEMRGVWIPCMSLVLSEEERSENGFRKKFSEIAQRCHDFGLNTLIVHVRPYGDAIYRSEIFPWSHILSGTQGKGVDFDPLEIILEEAHKRGLTVHAWINPLRISTGQTPSKLSEDNPYIKWKNDPDTDVNEFVFEYNGGIYYDPSDPQVRKLILDGVRELTENYDIDGIHIDDYFYPSEETDYDKEKYDSYLNTVPEGCIPLSQKEWRKNNINMLVSGMYDIVHNSEKEMVFGISPQCNFENNELISADIKSWCSINGYADYICPQIYVSNDHPVFPFRTLADKWRSFVTADIKLYFGLGLYKAGTDADSGTWLDSEDNIRTQIEYSRKKNADGFILYSYDYLSDNTARKEVKNAAPIITGK